MSNDTPKRLTVFWIFISFAVWVIAFRGFLSSKFTLTSDALSYYDHTKFFIENLKAGVFPLWDPFWSFGSPNDFFLRRIGSLNPFYSVVLLFNSIGIPYTLSYLWFLGLYYWGGMVAFYLLAMRIYQDRLIAYAGYLILLFSALGTRLFDSYMMLITVPLIWFFYFLVAFSQTPKKYLFLGMILSFMILASTYIPLYFLIIAGLFLLLFSLIYFNLIPEIFRRYVFFIKENKLLVVLSLLALVLSFLPIISFFHDTARGQVVLPVRHGDASLGQALVVPHKTLDWGAVEDLLYSYYFSNLKLYKFAVVYVPFFSVIVLILGLIGQISRRAVFIFLLGLVLFCSIVPHGLPFYDFFYQHVFFLKYFRNLHFFIWFFLIPLFVLLVLEHWKLFAQIRVNTSKNKWLLLAYVLMVHGGVFFFVWLRNDAVASTYFMIALSLAFWSLMVCKHLKPNMGCFVLLTLTILIQPLEAYHYFSLKAEPRTVLYEYDFSFSTLQFKDNNLIQPGDVSKSKDALYYSSKDYNFIYENISKYALSKYLRSKFILVDHLEPVGRNQLDMAVLEHHFLADDNTAVVYNNSQDNIKLSGNDPHPLQKARFIDSVSDGFKILAFNANHLQLAVNIPYEKFLIYNDTYDPYWNVTVNRARAQLYEVNGAFKGVWIPAGKSIVDFSYGQWWQYAMNIVPSIIALIVLMGIIYYACIS